MKKLLIFLALLIADPAWAAYYLRTDCGSVVGPIEGDVCSQSTTASSRTSGHLYIYRSSAWVDVDSAGSGAPTNTTYITQTPDGTLSNEQALSTLATGILKNTTATGVLSIASPGTDYVAPTGSGAGLTALNASALASGTAPTARLGTGTANTTTFLRGDNTWQAVTVGSLSANGANCSAGNAPLGVDASGAAEGCFDVATQNELDTHSNLTTVHGATSANTVNRIPIRDASGNFAAGSITANLVGNVSGNATSASTLSTIGSGTVPLKGDGAGATAVATGADLSLPHYCADAGANDTYACNLPTNPGTYAAGYHFWFKANTANTGAATINFNSQGIGAIKKAVGAITTDLVTGDICAGQIVEVIYDGTNFEMVSPLCQNPSVISGLTTGTIPKAASASTLTDSAIVEDADSLNLSKAIEVGDVSGTPLNLNTTGITGAVIDAEGTGNTITIPAYWDLDLVGVSGGTAAHVWNDDPLSTACTPAAVTGTNRTTGVCTFPDSDGDYGRQISRYLPDGWTGSFDAVIWWKTTGTGNARFQFQTICYADDEADDAAFNTASVVTAAAGTSARPNKQAITGITTTGCAAGELMRIRFFRNRTEGSDTLNAALDVEKVVFKLRVAH